MAETASSPAERIVAKKVAREDSDLAGTKTAVRVAARQIHLGDRLYEQILEQIVSGQFSIGDRLPSEMALCKSFRVSRPVVREALLRLRADGLVVPSKGSGTFVRRRPAPDFMALAPGGSIADLFRCWELRIPVECEAAFLAAQRRSSADLRAIEEALKEFEDLLGTSANSSDADLRFHHAVATASGNDLFVSVLASMHDSIDHGMKLAHELLWTDLQVRLKKISDEHMQVFEAIAAGDAEAARIAMRNHIESSRERILGKQHKASPPLASG